MGAPGWRPQNNLEAVLLAARERSDQKGYLSALTWADLLLPLQPDRPDDPEAVTFVEVSGRRCVLAFTSDTAITQVMGSLPPRRPVRFVELNRIWPDPEIWLAVNPGLPIEIFLGPGAVGTLAEAADEPVTQTEAALVAAADATDIDAYAAALVVADAVVPIDTEDGADTTDITDPDFGWCRMEDEGRSIMIYTSDVRMREQLGLRPYLEMPFAALLDRWPDDTTGLVVDAGASFSTRLAAPAVAEIAARVREIADGILVQVVVPPGGDTRYLDKGHNRVAGMVHRAPEGVMPLADLYRSLGLLGEGSPFGPDDEAGYVIRWYETDKDAYRAPQMDGVELRPGAALWQLDRSGSSRCVARYQLGADGAPEWVRIWSG